MAEMNQNLTPHFGALYSASSGITEEGQLFLCETAWLSTPEGLVPVLFTHAVADNKIVSSKVKPL